MQAAYQGLFLFALIVLGILLFFCLARAIKGPRVSDRVVAVNMMSTIIIITICVLTLMLGEGYLVDVAIVYAMIGFLAVVLLTKIYMGTYLSNKDKRGKKHA